MTENQKKIQELHRIYNELGKQCDNAYANYNQLRLRKGDLHEELQKLKNTEYDIFHKYIEELK